MKIQNNTYQQRQLALEGTVRELVQEIFRKSRNEDEAKLGLDVLKEVVTKLQMKPTTPILTKIGFLVDAAMKSAEHLSLADVRLAVKGQVVLINFKGSATVEVTSIDDNMTLFNVEAIRKGDRTRMIHVSEATLMSLVTDVIREMDANADGSVEKAHRKGVTPPDKTAAATWKNLEALETATELPGTEDVDVDELTEALLNDSEDDLLTKLFKGDNHAVKHFKYAKSRKTFAPSPKPVIRESQEAAKKPAAQTERELAKKEATDKGDLLKLTQLCKEEDRLFTPHVGFDGKLSFTGRFRRMENRHV